MCDMLVPRTSLARILITLSVIVLFLTGPVIAWVTVPSGYFIRVMDYHYDPHLSEITMVRNLMRGDVVAKSFVTVVGANGRSCYDRDERVYDAVNGAGTIITKEVFAAPTRLKPCLDSAPFTVVARFHVKVAGFVTLKPTFYFEPPR